MRTQLVLRPRLPELVREAVLKFCADPGIPARPIAAGIYEGLAAEFGLGIRAVARGIGTGV